MYKRNLVHPRDLAEQACDIELNKLGEPIGKQDQYIAAFGGLTCFTFNRDGSVDAAPLNISKEALCELEDSLVLFFTGFVRSASAILREQDDKSKLLDNEMTRALHRTKELGRESKQAFEAGDVHRFGELMHLHWEEKKKRSAAMSNPRIDEWYTLARANGAIGGKLIGAGGGGFLVFCTRDKAKLRQGMAAAGMEEVRFKFDFEGTKAII
jgi:D-glycero-alpha-D-manno-heptose-7-phosphate kinase